MQRVTEAWEQTNRDNFTRPANVILTVHRTDGTSPIVGGTRLISFNYNKIGDCLSSILTQDTITFTFDNSDGRFTYDPDNDIYHNAYVTVMCGFMNESYESYDGINGGVYYISDIDTSNSRTAFTAKTILAFMKAKCNAYSGDCLTVSKHILAQAEEDKGVPPETIYYNLSDDLASVDVEILETDNYSMAEALQLIANACGCVLYVDRTGRVCIVPIGDVSENYVLSNKISYDVPKVKLAEKIGVIRFYYAHGTADATNAGLARKAGGTQVVTNPIMIDSFDAGKRALSIFEFWEVSRKKISGNFRADPRIDLFDIIVIPNGNKVSVCCITKINFTFNGSWRGTYEAVEIENAVLDLRICDLEMLTIKQLESLRIEQIHPNTISDVDGDYLASSNGELAFWKEDVNNG